MALTAATASVDRRSREVAALERGLPRLTAQRRWVVRTACRSQGFLTVGDGHRRAATADYNVAMPVVSIRFPDELHARLTAAAGEEGVAASTLAQQATEEWLRLREHPGVVFRDGPTGRRAGVAAGPDVWEVVLVLRDQEGGPDERVAATAEYLGLPVRAVETAARYWAAYPEEIDARLAANDEAVAREREIWERRQQLLGA
jgi:hypothetical protein